MRNWVRASTNVQVVVVLVIGVIALLPEQAFERELPLRADHFRSGLTVGALLIGGAGLWWERGRMAWASLMFFSIAVLAAIVLPAFRSATVH